ncbi:MAG: bifunctional glutamate N-acetyltransferase/amino-acid acetyltransferase ArgJ [Candidatus Binatia bacterium]
MKIEPTAVPGPVRGFRFSGVHGGLKRRGRRDLALIVADRPVVCAAVFTRNRAAAAPVLVAREHVADGRCRAVMINSGNANAATGEKGLRMARWSCRELASRLGTEASEVIPCSTGVIGVQLEKVPFARAISLAVDGLSRKGLGAAARAMMTSDAFPKWSTRTARYGGALCTITGLAKGAGMIHPSMATMLSVVVTDAKLSRRAAGSMLNSALAGSFNSISVDGVTSTNDTLLLLASGEAPGGLIDDEDSAGFVEVAAALGEVLEELARLVVRDGEGASKMVDVVVEGADDDPSARRLADRVATSILVKTALAGADPNWGRVLCELGNAGVEIDMAKLSINVDDVSLVRGGTLVSDEARRMARRVMRGDSFTIFLSVGKRSGKARVITSDLTEAYVHFNSSYTT